MHKKYIIFLITLILLIPKNVLAFNGKNYYSFSGLSEVSEINIDEIDHSKSLFVSETGSDDNDGSVLSPFKTINKAIQEAGENYTIYIREGTYNEAVVIDKSNITLRNYPNEVAKITGVNEASLNFNIKINPNLSNITIYGLNIQDHNEISIEAVFGIFVNGNVRNLIIQNNEFTNINGNELYKYSGGYNAGGIVIYGNQDKVSKNILITGNKFHDMDCGRSEAITVTGYVTEVDIIENEVKDIVNIGIDVVGGYGANSNPDYDYARYIYVAGNKVENAVSTIAYNGGIYVDGAQAVLVERNKVSNCPYGISIDQEIYVDDEKYTAQDIIVSSNLFINNTIGGIRFGGSKGSNTSVINSKLINNTVINPATSLSSALVFGKGHDNEVINNVIIDEGTWNNLIYTDDFSEPTDLYNTNIFNNYLYTAKYASIERYFVFANTKYSKQEFLDLEFVNDDNKIAIEEELNLDYSVKDTSILNTSGLSNGYTLLLRDYNGDLRDEPLSLGYITNSKKVDTEDDLNKLNEKFGFKKDYEVVDPIINTTTDPTNNNENNNTTTDPTNNNENNNTTPDPTNNNENDNTTTDPTNNNENNNTITDPTNNNENNNTIMDPTNNNESNNTTTDPTNNNENDNTTTDENNTIIDDNNEELEKNNIILTSALNDNLNINNPKTGDDIIVYFIMSIISLIGLTIIILKKDKLIKL